MSPAIGAAFTARERVVLAPGDLLGSHPALGRAFSSLEPERAHLYQMLGQMGTADAAVILPRLVEVTHDAEEAARLTMPVLCLVGDQDALIPPTAVRALADVLPDARVAEITGSGHSPYFEDPAAWNAVVGQFLGQVDGGLGR
jgi:2-succinyl-6-hydroxy-2,4-cyclohexadiene-1-carboxylate synthase